MTPRCACLPACRCGWLKKRLAAKRPEEYEAIVAARFDRQRNLGVLIVDAANRGKRWVSGVAGR